MHVPDIIGNQLYKMFASPVKREEQSQSGIMSTYRTN